MRILVTGGTGLIGVPLCHKLASSGHEVIVLTRNPAAHAGRLSRRVRLEQWDGRTPAGWGHLLTGQTAIINLAGENPAHWRWTPAHRKRVLESRLHAAQAIAEAIHSAAQPPCVLLQASAVGYYGDCGDDLVIEASPPGDDWRAQVCVAWEDATAGLDVRRCLLRIGIVLDSQGGALPAMLLASRLYGKCMGSGKQWIPWIHTHDVARSIHFLLDEPKASGVFNLTAPHPETNRHLMQALSSITARPPLLPVPAWALWLALGEMATTVLDSQRVLPERLLALGFHFQFDSLVDALRHLLEVR